MRISRSFLGYNFSIKMKVTRYLSNKREHLMTLSLFFLKDLLYFSAFYDLDRWSKRKIYLRAKMMRPETSF